VVAFSALRFRLSIKQASASTPLSHQHHHQQQQPPRNGSNIAPFDEKQFVASTYKRATRGARKARTRQNSSLELRRCDCVGYSAELAVTDDSPKLPPVLHGSSTYRHFGTFSSLIVASFIAMLFLK